MQPINMNVWLLCTTILPQHVHHNTKHEPLSEYIKFMEFHKKCAFVRKELRQNVNFGSSLNRARWADLWFYVLRHVDLNLNVHLKYLQLTLLAATNLTLGRIKAQRVERCVSFCVQNSRGELWVAVATIQRNALQTLCIGAKFVCDIVTHWFRASDDFRHRIDARVFVPCK